MIIKKRKSFIDEPTKKSKSISLGAVKKDAVTSVKTSGTKGLKISRGGIKINGKQFIVKSMGFQTAGSKDKKSGKVFTKKDIGKSASNIVQYMNRADSVTDIDKDENQSLIYDSSHQLSTDELKEYQKELRAGVEGQHHFIISTGQDLSRDETIEMVRETMARFQEETGKNLDYVFAYHTDKSDDLTQKKEPTEATAETKNEDKTKKDEEEKDIKNHVHVLTTGSKSDVKFTNEQLQMLKIIAAQETSKILESRGDMDSYLNKQIDNSIEHLENIRKSNSIYEQYNADAKKLKEEENLQLKIAFLDETKNSPVSKTDIETYREVQKIEGNIQYMESHQEQVAKKEIQYHEKNLNNNLSKIDEKHLDYLKGLDDKGLESLTKYAASKAFHEKTFNNPLSTDTDKDKADSWLKNETKKLTPEQKSEYDSISNKELLAFKNANKEEIEISRLKSLSPEEITKEKIDFAKENLAIVEAKYSDTKEKIEGTFKEELDRFSDSTRAYSIHEEFTIKRIVLATETAVQIKEETGFDKSADSFMKREIDKDPDIKFTTNAGISARLTTTEELEKQVERLHQTISDKVLTTDKEDLKTLSQFNRQTENIIDKDSIQTLSSDIATQRNLAKALDGEETQHFRDLQKQFMNVKLVEKNGLDLDELKVWKEKETGSNLSEDEKEKAIANGKKFLSEESADQFIKNNIEHAKNLQEAGIFDKSNNFTSERAREILYENSDKDVASIAKANIEDYKRQGFDIEKIRESESARDFNSAINTLSNSSTQSNKTHDTNQLRQR